jgi:hypothetical protein
VDRDGDPDVVVISGFDNRVTWIENAAEDGSSWVEHALAGFVGVGTGALGVADLDGDGVQNGREVANGTDPGNPGTDDDGLTDGVETDTGTFVDENNTGTDPLDSDTDDDGLTDGDEVNTVGTDPNDPDTDSDGYCDGPSDPGGGACPSGVSDNCPNQANAGQTNSDALPAGDDCQCGDLDDDGVVEADDLLLARQHLMGKTVAADLTRCNVTGPSDGGASDCDVADIYVLQRVVAGKSATVEKTCQAYTGP